MIDREFSREQENWYRWFHERKCGLWENDVCPIMQEQRKHVRPPDMRFMPESIWGDPRNTLWFIGINPGQEKLGNPVPDVAAEREACLNTRSCDQSYEESRRRHNLVGTHREVRDHYVFADELTRASLGLLTGMAEFVDVDDERVTDATVSSLTIINMAHCKCPDIDSSIGRVEVKRSYWRECGAKNLEAVDLWRPKVLVCYGGSVVDWLFDVHRGNSPPTGWSLDKQTAKATGSVLGTTGVLTHEGMLHVHLAFMGHPSRRRPDLSLFNKVLCDAGV